MTEIPLPESNDDIYSLGFDKSLNRVVISSQPLSSEYSNGYSGLSNEPAQGIGFGALAAGIGESMFIMDPSKGLSLGSATFADAPFQVDMEGNLNASTQKLTRNFTAGEAIAIGDALYTSLYQSDGGIQWDTDVTGNGTSVNITIGSNSNRVLIAYFIGLAGAPAPTFDGVAMTLITSVVIAGVGRELFCYYLVAPNTGTKTLSWTGTNDYSAYSFYNVSQTSPINTSGNSSAVASTVDVVLSPTVEGTVLCVGGGQANAAPFVSGSPNNADLHLNSSGQMVTAHSAIIAGTANQTGSAHGTGVSGLGNISLLLAPFTTVVDGAFRADASAAATSDAFCGFAENSVSANGTVKVAYAGTITSLTGLSRGSRYYLSDTTGAISTSAGTVTRKVGIALGRSLLLITNIW